MNREQKVFYMHTLDNKPAVFTGRTVCFATFYGHANKLAKSLRQIKREQQISTTNRLPNSIFEYGHIRVELP